MSDITISTIIDPVELKNYLVNHNELLNFLDSLKAESDRLKQQVKTLNESLQTKMSSKPDLVKMTETKVQQELKEQAIKFDEIK